MKKIHYKQALAEIIEIVAHDPHHVYEGRTPDSDTPSCLYVHLDAEPPAPGCIIGVWLHDFHGFSLDDLAVLDGKGSISDLTAGGVTDSLVAVLVGESLLPFDLTQKAANFLRTLQFRQDHGDPWSTALFRAITQH